MFATSSANPQRLLPAPTHIWSPALPFPNKLQQAKLTFPGFGFIYWFSCHLCAPAASYPNNCGSSTAGCALSGVGNAPAGSAPLFGTEGFPPRALGSSKESPLQLQRKFQGGQPLQDPHTKGVQGVPCSAKLSVPSSTSLLGLEPPWGFIPVKAGTAAAEKCNNSA